MSRRRPGRKRCQAKRGEGDEQGVFWTRGDGQLVDFRNAFQLTYAEMAALSGFDDCGMRWWERCVERGLIIPAEGAPVKFFELVCRVLARRSLSQEARRACLA